MRRGHRLRPRPGQEDGPRGNKRTGGWIGVGGVARDDRTHWTYPLSRLVRQCGLLVSRDPVDGSFHRCEEADRPCCRPGPTPTWTQVPDFVARPGALLCYRFDPSVTTGLLYDSGSKRYHLSEAVPEITGALLCYKFDVGDFLGDSGSKNYDLTEAGGEEG